MVLPKWNRVVGLLYELAFVVTRDNSMLDNLQVRLDSEAAGAGGGRMRL